MTLRKRKAELVVAAQSKLQLSIKRIKTEKLEAEVNDQKDETQYTITHSQRQADAIDRLKLAATLGADLQHVRAAAALHGSC